MHPSSFHAYGSGKSGRTVRVSPAPHSCKSSGAVLAWGGQNVYAVAEHESPDKALSECELVPVQLKWRPWLLRKAVRQEEGPRWLAWSLRFIYAVQTLVVGVVD